MNHPAPDIWNETYKRENVRGIPCVAVMTVISETDHQRRLIARMDIEQRDPGSPVDLTVTVNMTPAQMRALAASLQAHATRVEQVLMPLLQPAPTIIPIALYREPETA